MGPYQPHYEEEVSSLRLAVTQRCAAAAAVSSLLRKHLPPDDQLTHALLRSQRQQAVVLAVQTHVQQVLFGKMVGDQVGLEGECVNAFYRENSVVLQLMSLRWLLAKIQIFTFEET